MKKVNYYLNNKSAWLGNPGTRAHLTDSNESASQINSVWPADYHLSRIPRNVFYLFSNFYLFLFIKYN